ncbi:MAG: agmatinase family protein [Alistipes sp.]|jgi:agmatinase|nr:agmatinase family protein [Alistipes sp.]
MSEKIVEKFDPDGVGVRNGNYFGMTFTPENASLVLLSVPWDVTSSYGGGASAAPDAMIEESTQLDFHDPWAPGAWRRGIATIPIDYSIAEKSIFFRKDASKIIEALEAGADVSLSRKLDRVNSMSHEIDDEVYAVSAAWLAAGKTVGLVGGDHSTPLGLIRAVAEREGSIGILHFDAHCDLREAYEGFDCSHASIMFNVLRDVPGVEKIVQVGVRDFSEVEARFAAAHPKIVQFPGAELAENEFRGENWAMQTERIVAALPDKVYVSFDVDFLSPEFCPGTGTPVPGGRSFDEAMWLLRRVVDSGRRIVGFDLCEVSPRQDSTWDANVGARILFRLCGQALREVPKGQITRENPNGRKLRNAADVQAPRENPNRQALRKTSEKA